MNTPQRRSVKAIPILIAVHALALLPLLTGCGRQNTGRITAADSLPSQSSLPPITASQIDLVTPAPAESSNTVTPAAVTAQPVTESPAIAVSASNLAPAGAGKDYTVARGDTLFKIARANKIKTTAISKANPSVDFAKLKVGQKIKIPAPVSAPTAATLGFREPSTEVSGNVHVVKPGETLTHLAKLNHTTIKAIQDANGLKTTRVLVGQKLKLPTAATPLPNAAPKPSAAVQPQTVDATLAAR